MTAQGKLARGAARAGMVALALTFGGGAVWAGEAQDRLFALHALSKVETGQTLVYDFSREGAFPTDKLPKIAHGEARLTLEPAQGDKEPTAVALLRDDDKTVASFDPFPADAGNPIFMVFMEETVASMAKITGGSSFYIRNRMRDALGAQDTIETMTLAYDGQDVPARKLTFQPFLNDKNAAKMGQAFVDLTITFVMSDEVPGEFLSMEAVTAKVENGEPLMDLKFDLSKVEEG
jgi:hypothetical protein